CPLPTLEILQSQPHKLEQALVEEVQVPVGQTRVDQRGKGIDELPSSRRGLGRAQESSWRTLVGRCRRRGTSTIAGQGTGDENDRGLHPALAVSLPTRFTLPWIL